MDFGKENLSNDYGKIKILSKLRGVVQCRHPVIAQPQNHNCGPRVSAGRAKIEVQHGRTLGRRQQSKLKMIRVDNTREDASF